MKDLILQSVKLFLDQHYRQGSPLLLGCSGGPDSLALLHLLKECQHFFSIPLHVAHIDHSWRLESAMEARELKEIVLSLGFPFHLQTLNQGMAVSEEEGRKARLTFFASLYQKLQCQALLLGHQADDQAETVLKRVLEGAGLEAMGGIRPVVVNQGMVVWRPLLTHSKKEVLSWLAERGHRYVDDPTNRDVKYLRSRMRVKMIPDLESTFGKKISNNLIRLGDFAHDLTAYLQRKNPLFQIEKQYALGRTFLDFNPYYPIDPFELKLFLRLFLKKEGISISFRSIDIIKNFIENKSKNKNIDSIIINDGFLYLT